MTVAKPLLDRETFNKYIGILDDEARIERAHKDLIDLTREALERAAFALKVGCDRIAESLIDVALDLNAADDQLSIDGENYIDAAEAFVSAGLSIIDAHLDAVRIEARKRGVHA